ncbi:PHD/FYVE-zinc-finger like domain-containing protein [Aspergillus ambiguus]|uniref:putative chromatin remodeling complex subunit (Chd3) n=1 Tax=Aspergillus ambiguus TaxID=176160 RepID=UPI003CCCC520
MDPDTSSTLDEQLISDLFSMSKPETKSKSPEEQRALGSQVIAVEVPSIPDADEYKFLPGHFDVRCVIRETNTGLYSVKLRSGETETMTSSTLETFDNGAEALTRFQNSGKTYSTSSASESMMTSSGESCSSEAESLASRRRSTRNTQFTRFFDGQGSDMGASSDASSDDIISSAVPRKKGRLKRGLRRGRPRKSLSGTPDIDVDYAPKGTRFSTRNRKTLRLNLRERLEDDISENEDSSRSAKFFGAREAFRKIAHNDPFRQHHRDICEVCYGRGDDNAKGPLVFCQGCTSAFHQQCLGPRATREHLVTKVADDQFLLQCRRCIGVGHKKDRTAPHQGFCAVCNVPGNMSEPLRERLTPKQEQHLRQENGGTDPATHIDSDRVNNVGNLLFRCTTCHRAFHPEHCSDSFKTTWQCQDCFSAPGELGAMVAWRPNYDKSYTPGTSADAIPESQKDYLIKWKEKSYKRVTWMPGTWVFGVANGAMLRAFYRSEKSNAPRMTTAEAVPESFLRVDIIFDVKYSDDDDTHEAGHESDLTRIDKVTTAYVKFKGLAYEESVWEEPPDPGDTERWNDFKSAYEDFIRRDYVSTPDTASLKKHLSLVRKQNFKKDLARDKQPDIMTGGEVMDYQKDGMNWLYYMWFHQRNAILADEMGLGKTIQVIGLFATLIQDHKCWPFLAVVPNSTCPNWRKEIKTWVPSIRVVTYYGSAYARKLAQDYEMFSDGDPDLRCHIVVTSYETMADDASRRVLSKVPWAGLVVDEGQRLKNDKSQLYEALSRIKFPFKILLTGTPLQNNIRELFNLLQFCDPTIDAEHLEEEYGVLSKDNIPELHNMIRPFFLRRTKAQVLTFLPPVVQIIVPVSMSVVQKKLYKSILAKNPLLIKAIFQRQGAQELKPAERHNLNNILMQLRKCLCHPFVYSEAIEERTTDTAASFRNLVDAAGKLKLLELMLPKLHQRGHRVLIFSQFLDNLNIIEDFLDGLGLWHCRLDGKMSSLEKQKMIDLYNADDSPYFAFLLSTRSGGVGINLATADTVIIMDPDFNPHQDMQALSRAHRIGQKNKVLVFQLMTRGSAEEKIMQIGKKKMVLDHVLIDRMVSDEDDGRDLESILRHGAQALFDDDDSGDVHYDSESVDKLLDRSQAEQTKSLDENAESNFSFARVWANDRLDDDLEDTGEDSGRDAAPSVWEKILKEREQAAAEEARRKAETLGRGKRKRASVTYTTNEMEVSPQKVRPESDGEFKAGDAAQSESESGSAMSLASRDLNLDLRQRRERGREERKPPAKKAKIRPFQRVHADEDLLAIPSGLADLKWLASSTAVFVDWRILVSPELVRI